MKRGDLTGSGAGLKSSNGLMPGGRLRVHQKGVIASVPSASEGSEARLP